MDEERFLHERISCRTNNGFSIKEEFRRVQQVLPSLSYRNQSLIHLLLYAGLRASELVELRLWQIDWIGQSIEVHGKGDKVREVPLRIDTLRCLRQYVEEDRTKHRQAVMSPYIFLSQRGERLTRGGLSDVLRALDTNVGRHLYPHLFRHTFATRLTQKHVDITVISRLLGHHSIEQTNRYYIQTSKEEKQQAVEQLWK